MKSFKPILLTLTMCAIAIYLVIYYWASGEKLVMTLISAVSPFIMGAMIAYIVNILMSRYENFFLKWVPFKLLHKASRGISLLLAYSTFALIIAFILGTVIPELTSSIQTLVSKAPTVVQNLITEVQENKWINKLIESYFGNNAITEISRQVNTYLQGLLKNTGNIALNLLNSVSNIFSIFLNIFVGLVFSIYVLASKETLGQQFRRLIKAYLPKFYEPFDEVREVFDTAFQSFFVGQTLEAMILGSLAFLGMQLLNLPYAPTVSILVGFTALIPVFGAYIGVVIGAILIMTQSFDQAMIFLIFIVILQQFEGNLIYPRVVGQSVGLPGMWVIVAITIGGALGGIVGMLMAVPFFAACYKLIGRDVQKRLTARASVEPVTE